MSAFLSAPRIRLPLAFLLCGAVIGGCRIYDERLLSQDESTTGPDRPVGVGDARQVSRRGRVITRGGGGPGGHALADAALPTADAALPSTDAAFPDTGPAPQDDDGCPDDPEKDQPGSCGCGVPEPNDGTGTGAGCDALRAALRHRYRFEGTGSVAADAVAGLDGAILHASLADRGALFLPGGTSGAHVALPAGMVSALGSATIELWVEWPGGVADQALFNFGSTNPAPPAPCVTRAVSRAGSDYYFCPGPVDWRTAHLHCRLSGGTLAVVDDADEQAFIESQPALQTDHWFAANDLDNEGTWCWAKDDDRCAHAFWSLGDGGPDDGDDYTHWASGQPDNYYFGENCGVLFDSGRWNDTRCWTRRPFICELPEERVATLHSALRLTPADSDGVPRLSFHLPSAEVYIQGTSPLPAGRKVQVAVVVDIDAGAMRLYVDGRLEGTARLAGGLNALDDSDNWLGRSLLLDEPNLTGTMYELRFYGAALTQAQLTTSAVAGPDPDFLDAP